MALPLVSLFDVDSPPFKIIFHGSDGNELGRLEELDDGKLSFVGNVDETAQLFFDTLIMKNSKYIHENIINKKSNKNEKKRKV